MGRCVNYRHIYHAGNFADVAKHVALLYCLEALQRKEGAWFALDTHAGRGFYDLQAAESVKSGEAERGVQQLVARTLGAAPLERYFDGLRARRGKRLSRYPGSPALISRALRPQDRAVFVETLPAEARAMQRELESAGYHGRVEAKIGDGYAALKALLPPPERRGLVLIDPPYESMEELKLMLQAFSDAHGRWPTGTYLLWYPIRSAAQRRLVHARFQALSIPKMLCADLTVYPDDAGVGLAGSGLLIVNPPYGADDYLQEAYRAIHQGLSVAGAGYVEVQRLTPEVMAK
jgi:23S rRNA (adenine2030-N6)-methyltransferase